MRLRPPSPGSRVATLGVALAAVVCAGAASAQTGCRFVEPTLNVQGVTIAGLGQVLYVSRPSILCADGVRIRADSAVTYASQSRTELMGRVFFRDDTRELRSDQARYFSQQARLQASGNLFVRDTVRGTEIENGDLVYLRRADFRPEEEMTVTRGIDGVRPRARLFLQPAPDSVREEAAGVDSLPVAAVDTLAARDTLAVRDTAATRDTLAAAPPEESVRPTPAEPDTVPYLVEANRLFLQGEGIFRAYGDVEIRRDSLNAYADSTAYDQTAGLILMQGSARVDGAGYDLSGREIGLGVPDGTVRSVRAVREGVLTGEDLRLTAPVIEIFLSDGVMQRLVATPLRPVPGATEPPDEAEEVQPVAEAEEFTLTADSIDVLAPDELLDRIIAVGTARGESHARDSLNVEALPDVALHDWLEGDTVIATFIPADTGAAVDSAAAADTARARYQLDRLVARGQARSLYRLEPSDSASRAGVDPPAVHYVMGSVITIVLERGDVDRMEVEGPTQGWHFEPQRARSAADSLAPPDTSGLPPDTSGVRPDTSRALPDTARVPAPDRARDPSPAAPTGPVRTTPRPSAAPAPRLRPRRRRA